MKIGTSTLKRLARMSQGFVGSDIESVCRRARLAAMEKHLHPIEKTGQLSKGPRADSGDFQKALEDVKKRINNAQKLG